MPAVPCIPQCGKLCDELTDSISTIDKWNNLKDKALSWIGLGKFGEVHAIVDWNKCPGGTIYPWVLFPRLM